MSDFVHRLVHGPDRPRRPLDKNRLKLLVYSYLPGEYSPPHPGSSLLHRLADRRTFLCWSEALTLSIPQIGCEAFSLYCTGCPSPLPATYDCTPPALRTVFSSRLPH